ncbi:MAG: SRPBCC family protein [Phycisphaerales bacterium]|nr:SRPBCC family protein [Phycisphaerales bacterium]
MTIAIEKAPRGYALTATTELPGEPASVFPFFADAFNLDAITPARLRFRILTPAPIGMRSGALLDYRIMLYGLPIRWRTRIAEWDPPFHFVDEQLRGPYLWWRHRHSFERRGDATLMTDRVEYGVPGGSLVHALLVRRNLLAIFRYRAERIATLLAAGM